MAVNQARCEGWNEGWIENGRFAVWYPFVRGNLPPSWFKGASSSFLRLKNVLVVRRRAQSALLRFDLNNPFFLLSNELMHLSNHVQTMLTHLFHRIPPRIGHSGCYNPSICLLNSFKVFRLQNTSPVPRSKAFMH